MPQPACKERSNRETSSSYWIITIWERRMTLDNLEQTLNDISHQWSSLFIAGEQTTGTGKTYRKILVKLIESQTYHWIPENIRKIAGGDAMRPLEHTKSTLAESHNAFVTWLKNKTSDWIQYGDLPDGADETPQLSAAVYAPPIQQQQKRSAPMCLYIHSPADIDKQPVVIKILSAIEDAYPDCSVYFRTGQLAGWWNDYNSESITVLTNPTSFDVTGKPNEIHTFETMLSSQPLELPTATTPVNFNSALVIVSLTGSGGYLLQQKGGQHLRTKLIGHRSVIPGGLWVGTQEHADNRLPTELIEIIYTYMVTKKIYNFEDHDLDTVHENVMDMVETEPAMDFTKYIRKPSTEIEQ
jgi:hypothetical protein